MSTATNWSKCPFSKEALCRGEGFLIDGDVKAVRVHSVFVSGPKTVNIKNQEDNLPTRFICCEIDLVQAYPRILRDDADINYKQNTEGSKKYIAPKLYDADALAKAIGGAGTALPDDFLDERRNTKVHPAVKGRFELFLDASAIGVKDIAAGATVRFFTIGSSVFVERFEKVNGRSQAVLGLILH
jgi:hypothetical protein